MIGPGYVTPFIYDTETGDVPDRAHEPRRSGFQWVSLYATSDCREYHYLRHHGTPQYDAPVEDSWLVSHTTMGKEGWIMDLEGKHRFWLPVEWRASCRRENWHQDIATLFIRVEGQAVLIKF